MKIPRTPYLYRITDCWRDALFSPGITSFDLRPTPGIFSRVILKRRPTVHGKVIRFQELGAMSPGYAIAHYRVTAKLGQGGMGEVWRGTDTKLNRDVAIKILPESFAQDADRMARFEREAQVLASLNHPSIAAIYGVEDRALVLELVEGPTLAERIEQGAIPLEEALPVARQIAEALEYAHEHGVVHRDLKPANIKITPEGRVKVLDFGLAKALGNEPASGDPASSPTLTMRATMAGVIMGTVGYMASEQARGQAVDRRADIWAFGVVLYEMLTGRQLFTGPTISDALAAVLKTEADVSAIPAQLRPVVERCLRKDPRRRWRDIGDVRLALEEDSVPAPVLAGGASRRSVVPWALAGALATALVIAGIGWWRAARSGRDGTSRPLMRFGLDLGPGAILGGLHRSAVILSPDGTRLVFLARGPSGIPQLFTRALDQPEATPLPGTENAADPFFRPDGQWIGFFADDRLKKVSVHGGAVVDLANATAIERGGSWGEDGNIIAALASTGGLVRIPESGGYPHPVTQIEAGETGHRYPQVLPGAAAIIFATSNGASYVDADIEVLSLRTGRRKTLVRSGFFGRYLASGHLAYMYQDSLFAAPMDLDRLEITGPPVKVLDEVATSVTGTAQIDFSRTGRFST
jgi:serine/threonine-protein kinase